MIFMTEKDVYIIAGGEGISTGFNTIESKVPYNKLINYLDKNNDMDLITKLEKSEELDYSVWAYSGKKKIKIGDFIFITYKNAAIYMGTVYGTLQSKKFNNEYWGNSRGQENKIILNNVIKIFIPDPLNKSQKKFTDLLNHHNPGKNLDKFNKIKSLYEKGYGFKEIIDKESKIYNFQGIQKSKLNLKEVMHKLEDYCEKCNFECINRVI